MWERVRGKNGEIRVKRPGYAGTINESSARRLEETERRRREYAEWRQRIRDRREKRER
jgi:hypothetical protein